MAILITDCPRCPANHVTFDVLSSKQVDVRYGWQRWFETFCICRHCHSSTVFVLSASTRAHIEFFNNKKPEQVNGSLNDYMEIEGFISIKDRIRFAPPDHIPPEIAAAFNEGATCISVECWNAAGTMFRLCVDLATKPMLPPDGTPGIKRRDRRDLGLRLPWLFKNGRLDPGIEPLSTCIREDGNDGAHMGALNKEDAEDLHDFTTALLERIYTEPERLKLAERRRDARRQPKVGK
jgi:hypothetical protein